AEAVRGDAGGGDAQSRRGEGGGPDAAHEGRRAAVTVYEKKGWFRLELPEGWEVDEDESPVAIYHPEGAGALQVTAETPRPLPPGGKIDVFLMLRAFLKQTGVEFDETLAVRSSERGLDRAFYEYTAESPEEGEVLWRSWMVTNHD